MLSVQIFGVKNPPATRAAERFFKERRVGIHFVDLKENLSPGEIKRFVDRFGLLALLDTEGKAHVDAGLKYLKLSDAELRLRIERDPTLQRLPLVRGGKLISTGHDEDSWKAMLAGLKSRLRIEVSEEVVQGFRQRGMSKDRIAQSGVWQPAHHRELQH
jgi:arsenate reductase